MRIREVLLDENGELKEPVIRRVETTVGRALIWTIVPDGMAFDMINQDMTKKTISKLINHCYRTLGVKTTVVFADQLMYMGFPYATRAGVSFGIEDMAIPERKERDHQRGRAGGEGNPESVCIGFGDRRRTLQQGGRYLVPCQRPGGQSDDGWTGN